MPSQVNQPLPGGYILNGYRIEKPLSSGGFSIVYLAYDETGTPFVIKEYLPAAIALRADGAEVRIDDPAHLAAFRHGLKCFFEEGRALALISHPNVVRVENFFRANETVYMVMQYERGRTLQFHVQKNRDEFTEKFMRHIFVHLLNGLREVHTNKLLHLDIKPANIYIARDGRPVLLDFGAARITLSEEPTKLRTMFTAGFAAPEQYGHAAGDLGPWSDIYSVGATLYTCIAGTPPQAADARLAKDRLIPVRSLSRQAYSEELYTIVEACLSLNYLDRPQTAFELQKLLQLEPQDPARKGLMDSLSQPLAKFFQR
jgi:serine/threonine protein kinase